MLIVIQIFPYLSNAKLSPEEKRFNKSFCLARVPVEQTFGVLKAGWRRY